MARKVAPPKRKPSAAPAAPEPPIPVAPAPIPGRTLVLLVAGMLVLHYGLAASSLVRENPTVDEVNHLPAGVSYYETGSFRLYHHNPPLVKLVAALPVVMAGGNLHGAYDDPKWREESVPPALFGMKFTILNLPRYFELFRLARLMMPLFSVLGGLVVFAWSRRLFGDRGGLLSLALWCLCPNILAHGRLVTSDVGGAAIGAAATYTFWRYLHAPTWRRATLAGLVLGLAQLTKFSMLLLYPLWPVLWLAFSTSRHGLRGMARGVPRAMGQGAAIVALSVLIIDIGYGFEGTGRPLGNFRFASRSFLTKPGTTPGSGENDLLNLHWRYRVNRFRGTWLGRLPSPLPAHYLLGFDEQKIEADGFPRIWADPGATDPDEITGYTVYLDGALRRTGWRSYYALAFLYKTPEGTLALLALALAALATARRARAPVEDELVLILPPLAFFGAMTFLTDINLGLRYVLPVFPYLFIFAGRLAPWSDLGPIRRIGRGLIGVYLAATVLAVVMIHPHYLAYFNYVSGGPDREPPRLIDSNLDWGQDLVGLREWMRAHLDEGPIGLAYFGQVSPNLFALRGDPFAWYLPPWRVGTLRRNSPPAGGRDGPAPKVRPGLYAVSASLRQGISWRVYDPAMRLPGPFAVWAVEDRAYDYFRLARPFARIGHSILLFRLSEGDAARLEAERLRPPDSPG